MPGHLDLGERELELHPAEGHTADGMAVWMPWAGVLVGGDYLSPVEIPMLSARAARAAPTWRRWSGSSRWSSEAEHVVPGHGGPIDGARALAILNEDRAT